MKHSDGHERLITENGATLSLKHDQNGPNGEYPQAGLGNLTCFYIWFGFFVLDSNAIYIEYTDCQIWDPQKLLY